MSISFSLLCNLFFYFGSFEAISILCILKFHRNILCSVFLNCFFNNSIYFVLSWIPMVKSWITQVYTLCIICFFLSHFPSFSLFVLLSLIFPQLYLSTFPLNFILTITFISRDLSFLTFLFIFKYPICYINAIILLFLSLLIRVFFSSFSLSRVRVLYYFFYLSFSVLLKVFIKYLVITVFFLST